MFLRFLGFPSLRYFYDSSYRICVYYVTFKTCITGRACLHPSLNDKKQRLTLNVRISLDSEI